MKLDLSGKHVLITGGSKGIGLACAQAFLEEGAKVAISSRSQDNIDAALARLGSGIGIAADLSDEAQAARMVAKAEAEFGPIDVLVNSAGAAKRRPPDELTPALWRAAMDAKYFSYINVIDPVIKLMAARGSGVVINIIGNGGKMASPAHLAGGAANAALMLATVGLATAYAGKGIRVVGLNPGLTDTDRVAEGLKAEEKISGISAEKARANSLAKIPMGRMAAPQEIASTAVFLASAAASYINGVNITMDGASTPIVL